MNLAALVDIGGTTPELPLGRAVELCKPVLLVNLPELVEIGWGRLELPLGTPAEVEMRWEFVLLV